VVYCTDRNRPSAKETGSGKNDVDGLVVESEAANKTVRTIVGKAGDKAAGTAVDMMTVGTAVDLAGMAVDDLKKGAEWVAQR